MLIGLLLAISVALTMIPIAMQNYLHQIVDQEAAASGKQLADLALGVQSFIVAAQSNPALIPGAPVTGSAWLKPPSCGGLATNPAKGYIPCSFPSYGANDTLFNANYTTYFTNNAGLIEARTTLKVQFLGDPRNGSTIAAKIANAAMGSSASAGGGGNTFFQAYANAPYTTNASSVVPYGNPNYGRVTLVTSNASSQSIFLRVDGTNQMLANLNMGGNDLINAKNINASGNATIAGNVTASAFQTNPGGGQFNSDQGGSLELGGNNGTAGSGTPYVDFHLAGQGVQGFNARIINQSPNNLIIQGANGQGSLTAQGSITPGAIGVVGAACSPNGAMASSTDGSGFILSCQSGAWHPVGGRWLRIGYYLTQDGTQVFAPSCPAGGSPSIVVVPQSFRVNPTTAVSYGATGTGTPWTVYIRDGSNAAIAGATAIASTYCTYP